MGEPQQNEPYVDDERTTGVPHQAAGETEEPRNEQGPGAETAPVPRARTPHTDEEPDVYLDVPRLSVDEINLKVERLRARVALQARVLDVLSLNVGADVDLDGVELEIKGVEAEAELKVRLGNVESIIEHVLHTIDENPEIVEATARTVSSAAEGAVEGAGRAARGVGQVAGGVTEGAGQAAEGAGQAVGGATEGVGQAAGGAAEDVGQAAEGVTESAGESAQGPGGSSDIGDTASLPGLGDTDVPEQRPPSTAQDGQDAPPSDGSASEQEDGAEDTADGSGEPENADGAERTSGGSEASEPDEPAGSEEPEGPEASGGNGEPAATGEQEEPEDPGGAEEAGSSEAPEEQGESGGEPEGHVDPGEPAGSEGSGDTGEPEEPEKSGEPEGSEGAGEPEEAEDSGNSGDENADDRWSRIRNEAKQMRRASRKRFLKGLGSGAKQVGREVGGAASRVVSAVRKPE